MGTFTLHADFNLLDGAPSTTTQVTIRAVGSDADGDLVPVQVVGSDGTTIFEETKVPVTAGVLDVDLPADDNDPGAFGYLITRQGRWITKRWQVPVQAPAATVELATFTDTTPLPLLPSEYQLALQDIADLRTLSDSSFLANLKAMAGAQYGIGGYDRAPVTAATINQALIDYKFYSLKSNATDIIHSAGLGIQVPAGATLDGDGSSILRLAAGQPAIGALLTNADSSLAVTGPMSRIRLEGFTVDGNGVANATLGSPGGGNLTTAGIYLLRTPLLHVNGVDVANCSSFHGFYMDGNGVGDNRDHVVSNVHCYDNHTQVATFSVSQTSRQTQLNNIQASNNTSAIAIFCDVSEMQTSGLYAYNNTGTGIKINNVHSSLYANLTAINNGFDGILVEEMVRSSGAVWKACGNGWNNSAWNTPSAPTSGGGWSEVRFTEVTQQTYGITRNSAVDDIDVSTHLSPSTGSISGSRYADYGLYVGDGVTRAVHLRGVQLGDAGHLQRMRLPTAMGELRVALVDGTTYPDVPGSVTNLFWADPAMANTTVATTLWGFQNGSSSVVTLTRPDNTTVKAIKVTCSGSGAHAAFTKVTVSDINVAALAGQDIAFSMSVQTDAALTDVSPSGTFFDGGGAQVGTMAADTRPTTRGLSRYMNTAVVPATAVTFRPKVDLRPQADVGSAAYWFTEMMVTAGKYTPEVYGDGDVTASGWVWNGTARSSSSTRTVPYTATQAKQAIDTNTAAIATKVPTSRQVIAGTGLTGGGDLSADRTLTLGTHAASHNLGGSDVLTFPSRLLATSAPAVLGTATTAVPSGIVNSTATFDVFNITVPAASVAAGDVLEALFVFDLLNRSGGAVTYTFTYKLGTTTLHAPAAFSVGSSAAGRCKVTARIELLLATLSDQRCGITHLSTVAAGTLGTGQSTIGAATATEDLSSNKALALTVAMGTASVDADVRPISARLARIR